MHLSVLRSAGLQALWEMLASVLPTTPVYVVVGLSIAVVNSIDVVDSVNVRVTRVSFPSGSEVAFGARRASAVMALRNPQMSRC